MTEVIFTPQVHAHVGRTVKYAAADRAVPDIKVYFRGPVNAVGRCHQTICLNRGPQ
jgi:hypothetical protein